MSGSDYSGQTIVCEHSLRPDCRPDYKPPRLRKIGAERFDQYLEITAITRGPILGSATTKHATDVVHGLGVESPE